MLRILLLPLLLAAIVLAKPQFEVAPALGYMNHIGDNSLEDGLISGISLSSRIDANKKLEVGFERAGSFDYTHLKSSDTNINLYSTNLIIESDILQKATPYILIGGGYEHIEDSYLDVKSGFFGNMGAGVIYPFSRNINLKAQLRIAHNEYGKESYIASIGIIFPFGKEQTPSPAPAAKKPTQPTKTAQPSLPKAPTPKIPAPPADTPLVDSDQDGVMDGKDNCPDTPLKFAVDTHGCPKTYSFRALFDFDEYTIKEAYRKEVDGFATFLKKNSFYNVILKGHTDSIGSESYNKLLSKKRALAVEERLMKQGVDAKRIYSVGFGEERPVATNDTEEGRYKNRRVESTLKIDVK